MGSVLKMVISRCVQYGFVSGGFFYRGWMLRAVAVRVHTMIARP